MALSTYVGSFTLSSGIGSQVISGVGFQPKVLIFFWTRQTSAGFASHAASGFGVSIDRTTDQDVSAGSTVVDNVATTSSAIFTRSAQSIAMYANSFGFNCWANVSTYSSDGFTINKAVNDDGALAIVKFIALAGSDLEDAHVAEYTAKATTGTQAYTGVGFQGNAAIFFAPKITNSAAPTTSGTAGFSLGAATSSSVRAAVAQKSLSATTNTGINQASSYVSSSHVLLIPRASTTTFASETADFSSFDSDGFTLNWDTINISGPSKFFALILKGTFQAHVGMQARRTSTGTQNIVSPGFTPSVAMLWGSFPTSTATEVAEAHLCMGASDGTNHHSVWHGDAATINTDTNMYSNASNCYSQATNPSTIAAQASLSSFTASGYDLSWGTADGNARQFMHVALGSAATESPSTTARGLVRTYV